MIPLNFLDHIGERGIGDGEPAGRPGRQIGRIYPVRCPQPLGSCRYLLSGGHSRGSVAGVGPRHFHAAPDDGDGDGLLPFAHDEFGAQDPHDVPVMLHGKRTIRVPADTEQRFPSEKVNVTSPSREVHGDGRVRVQRHRGVIRQLNGPLLAGGRAIVGLQDGQQVAAQKPEKGDRRQSRRHGTGYPDAAARQP